ncbi:uncharacterized protein IUM83_14135 [Phytophthora cinnamomi]|uniref:uncharacterized protein n=1 Tax=Phytophthora cinnamomi TaxID=4785 RepID=UPI00355A5E1C|nr:hypothetical protein IUM83_14135 [Phytophthora cinnamomi]
MLGPLRDKLSGEYQGSENGTELMEAFDYNSQEPATEKSVVSTPGSETSTLSGASFTEFYTDDKVINKARIPREKVVVHEFISRGAFGKVCKGTYNGQPVAVKTMSDVVTFMKEIKMAATMSHPNIVQFIGVAYEEEKRPTGFDADKLKIALQVAHALAYLHSREIPVIHRDLKSKNILLNEALGAKLTDFGVSRERADRAMTADVGTSLWMAPEVMEEAIELRQEVRRLESLVAVLKIRSPEPGQESDVDAMLKQTEEENVKLRDSARKKHLQVAEIQSAGNQRTHPLYTRICLPKDVNQRRAKLMAIREEKLRNGYNFVMDPRHFVDVDKTTYSDELFESEEGDFCGVRFEIVQFPGVKSLKQVYDAAVYYLTNMEISITERLGHITVRDDYDSVDGSMYNARVLSSVRNGITMETSSLLFPKMDLEEKYGIVAIDSVDEDKLYPYNPAKRVRKDISATVVFTARRKPSTKCSGCEDELVVTMRGSAFLRIHRPQFPVPDDALQELSTGIMAWGDVMVKTIRSIVYGTC